MKRIPVLLPCLFATVGFFLNAPAGSQEFPAKPIRIISGPGPDVVARIIGQKFTEAFGQQVIVESLPAAGGKVAAETLARAAPDGYTLMNTTPSFLVATSMGVIPADVSRGVVPLALTNFTPFVLAVPAQLPAQSVAELIALAKSKPGQLNYASGGSGTLPHLAAELFKSMTATNVVHIPFKTAAQASTALLAGEVQMMVTALSVAGPQVRAGKLRVLAVTSLDRSKLAPEVPTLSEAGVSGYEILGWNGLVAPAGTSNEIIAKLNAVVRRALRSPEMAKQFASIDFEVPDPFPNPEQFGEFLKDESTRWAKLVKDSGARPD